MAFGEALYARRVADVAQDFVRESGLQRARSLVEELELFF